MNKAIVIFDGDCGICELCRNLLVWLDWFSQFECYSFHKKELKLIHPALTIEDCQKELKLIEKNGRLYGGADAVIRLCFRLPLVMPLAWLFWAPPFRQIARWLYPKIANNRHLISARCGLKKAASK